MLANMCILIVHLEAFNFYRIASQAEVLSALQRLGETLTTSELQFLEAHASTLMKNFDVVTDEEG